MSGVRLLQRQISPCLKNLDKRLHCAGGSVTQKAMLRLWTYLPLQGLPGSCVCEGLLELMGYTFLDGGRMLCPGGIQCRLYLYSCLNVKWPQPHAYCIPRITISFGRIDIRCYCCCPLESSSHIFKIEKAMILNQNDLFVMGNTWLSFLFLLPCCVFPNQAFPLEVFVS